MNEQDEHAAVKIIVHGRVQGVGFRHYTRVNAQQMELTGWVRNRADGTVEVWAEGPKPTLEDFISVVREGPASSAVRRLETAWHSPKDEYQRFTIRW
jgi:acylphosphatase